MDHFYGTFTIFILILLPTVCYRWMEKSSFDIYSAKYLLLRSKNKVIQVSNDMNASKQWQNSHILVNYHFKSSN